MLGILHVGENPRIVDRPRNTCCRRYSDNLDVRKYERMYC